MKLGEVRKAAWEQMDLLAQRKQALQSMLKEASSGSPGGAQFDRVEISHALAAVEDAYAETQAVAEELNTLDATIQNAEASRQQCEAMAEAMEDLLKILEICRRISKGDKVPPSDENKLMEYSHELYMCAKNMALMHKNAEGKKHDSLWGEEEPQQPQPTPAELAANTEVGNPLEGVSVPSTSGNGSSDA